MVCTNQIPSLTFNEYRGYVIGAWARPELTKGSTSIGVVYKRDKFGSLIQVKRIEGKLFATKEQAEQHGVELCKEWLINSSEFSPPKVDKSKITKTKTLTVHGWSYTLGTIKRNADDPIQRASNLWSGSSSTRVWVVLAGTGF
jgi:hypothetical protein